MRRLLPTLIVLLLLAGCHVAPVETPTPLPTVTVPPTYTPYPTGTPMPTWTPVPVATCAPIVPELLGSVVVLAWVDDPEQGVTEYTWDAGEPGADATVLLWYEMDDPEILPVFTTFSLRTYGKPFVVGDILPGGYSVSLLDYDDEGGCVVPWYDNTWSIVVNASTVTTVPVRFWATASCSTPTPVPQVTGTRTPLPIRTPATPTRTATAAVSYPCPEYWTQCRSACLSGETTDPLGQCGAGFVCCRGKP